jgi:hypothetical protein
VQQHWQNDSEANIIITNTGQEYGLLTEPSGRAANFTPISTASNIFEIVMWKTFVGHDSFGPPWISEE